MSRPIGAHYHVPHGMSNAMLLPVVTEWSIGGAPAKYAQAARHMGYAESTSSDSPACLALVEGLQRLCQDLSVPSPQSYGINRDDWVESLELMSAQALASGSPANNPRVPAQDEIVTLYERAWAPA